MLISEAISRLNNIKNDYGDIVLYNSGLSSKVDSISIGVLSESDGLQKGTMGYYLIINDEDFVAYID